MKESKMDHSNHDSGKPSFFSSRANIVLVGFLAIGGYFLITEHGAHILPFLPWLLLLACPLMHFFMHGGHGGHGEHRGNGDSGGSSSNGRQGTPHQH
jgi:Protein of unknown function (DUF2933)